ncbi:MAG: hypothetical protein AABX02_05040 [archaeon]
MPKYRIFEFESFEDDFSKIEKADQDRVERFILQLKENADLVGQPLGFPYIREKKFDGNRLYFVVYTEWNVVLLWGISDKKQQPLSIFKIKQSLPDLKKYVWEKITRGFE